MGTIGKCNSGTNSSTGDSTIPNELTTCKLINHFTNLLTPATPGFINRQLAALLFREAISVNIFHVSAFRMTFVSFDYS